MRKPILTGILTLTLAVLSTAAASAATVHPLLSTFVGGKSQVVGLAVDQANGDVFVASGETVYSDDTINIFSENGGAAEGVSSEINGVEAPAGGFNLKGTEAVAVDSSTGPSGGDVYIAEQVANGASAVDKYRLNPVTEKYEYVCQFLGYTKTGGLACHKNEPTVEETPEVAFRNDPAVVVDEQGNVYVMGGREGGIYEFDAAGEDVRTISLPASPEQHSSLAVDAAGNIYVNLYTYSDGTRISSRPLIEIERNPAGEPIAESAIGTELAYTLAFDNATGALFVEYARPLPEYKFNRFVAEYNANHQLTSEFGSGTLQRTNQEEHEGSLAVNFRTGEIYAANNEDGRVEGYGAAEAQTKPVVDGQSVMFVTSRTALLGATVNPGVAATTFRFVYGPTGGYGSSAPAREVALDSSGDVGVEVQPQALEGLQPGTTYHFAVVATNAFGQVYGPDQTFTTPPAPLPGVQTGMAEGVAQNTAVIFGSVDAEGMATTYEFDLGTDTSYGSRVFGNAGSGGESQAFSLSLSGLQPATTYHYRMVASNSYGTSYGVDRTFTTASFPTSALSAPSTLALVAVPDFAFPTTTVAATKKTAIKKSAGKKKKAGKKKRGKSKQKRAKKAARKGHGKQRRGK